MSDEPEFDRRDGEVLMEFPDPIKSLQVIDGKLFVILFDGRVIEATELTGEARH